MFQIKLFNKQSFNDLSIDEVLLKIKLGDKKLRELFINEYKQFILVAIYTATKKFVDVKNSDELSIGLLAFNEAINSYNPDKSISFFVFAEQVIKRRMIDYMRSMQKHRHVYPFTYFEADGEEAFEESFLPLSSPNHLETLETKEELLAFNKDLMEYGITIEDLIYHGPKHKDAIYSCIQIAKTLAEDEELFRKLDKKKNVPMNDLMKVVKVHARTVQRNRKFIIAVTLILKSQLSTLKEYVKSAEGRAGLHA